MHKYPEVLAHLIEQFQKLPGIGPRSAERITFALLSRPRQSMRHLSEALLAVASQIKRCGACFNFTTDALCSICSDAGRDRQIVCVVEHASDIVALESAHSFRGVYHVLMGKIAPLEGVNPEQLTIDALLGRVKKDEFCEVILATGADIDGETTALYISKLIKPLNVAVSRIATGIPVGASLDYSDGATIMKALQSRHTI